jgi:ATP-grasp domain
VLFGYRNTPPTDVPALEELVLRVATLAAEVPELAELDLNPVIVSERGALGVDVKARLVPGRTTGPDDASPATGLISALTGVAVKHRTPTSTRASSR